MYGYIVAVVMATLVTPYLHEGGHWFIGWLGKTGPKVEYELLIFPNGVHHEKIETMDSEIIRASGLAPFLWLPVAFLAGVYFLINSSPSFLFAALPPLMTVLMSTESDSSAFREPEKFREDAINGELSRDPLILPNLSRWIPGL